MKKNIGFNYKMSAEPAERISLIEDAGFDGVFIYSQYHPLEYIDLINKSKLNIETLHLSYKKFIDGQLIDSQYVNALWTEDAEADKYEKQLINEISFAHNYGIKTVVAHITGGTAPPLMCESGIKRISRILDVCEKYGIILCLENLRRLDYLEFVFKKLESDKLKFCFDSGHANAFTKNVETFPWNIFGDKLTCVHLNDNDGIADKHLLPLDGNIDWKNLVRNISKYNSDIELTLEVRCSEEQKNKYTEQEYLKLCFDSLVKIEKMILEEKIQK
ncbi:MAG: sugar phosphate isomerase/epimerase [Tannerella sp.]|jgi:sugar phosphate isomerase/epimerase|nr:sugar phosphate isomerase/epimerase [Tannerella sp.]